MTSNNMVQVKHCQIHLNEPARTKAAEALFPKAGVPAYDAGAERNRAEFTGPHFHGLDKVSFGENQVLIEIDGAAYMYPMHSIARVKYYTTEHTPE